MDNVAEEEEEVHSFTGEEDLDVKFSTDEAEIPVPNPLETRANSRFLSTDLSASRSPRFSNPTMERQSSFKYRRSNRGAENYHTQQAPAVELAVDPRQSHQSSYDEVETRVRTAPPTVSLKKSSSPNTPKYSPRNTNRTPVVAQQSVHHTPKSVSAPTAQATHASPRIEDSPASNVTGPEEPSAPVMSPAPATSPAPSSAATSVNRNHTRVPTRSPQPAPSRPSVTKRPVVEPSSASKRHSGIPTPQKAAFGSVATKSPAPVVTPTPAVVVHKNVKPASTAKPTTELLSPIRAKNFEEALKSAVSRSSTPTSLHRPRYSIDNLAIHAPTTPTISGKEWNGSVRVKKPSANLEAREHLNLIKQDSGEKSLSRNMHRPSAGDGLTAHNLNHNNNHHRQNGENASAFSHGSHQPGTPSSLFSPVSQRKYGDDHQNHQGQHGQRSVSSRSNTPTSLRPASSRPTSRCTTPTNASAARRTARDASLGQYFNTDEMTEISGHDSQAGVLHRVNSNPASGSLLSPYNLMVEGTHDRALDSASLSDADLQSVAKQMLLLRLMLQAKNAADAEKEEADILHAWQVVHSAEEQAQQMASQDSGIDEVSRTHQQILDMEKMVDELNDHLAPVFERLSAYRTLKDAQNALSPTSNTTTASDGMPSAPADPLLDAYSERAQAHKELQTRLAGLAKSVAALKKTVDSEGFVRPSEEALAAMSAAELENGAANPTIGHRVAPAVNPVRVNGSSAAALGAERSRSTSPAPTRRLSLVERQEAAAVKLALARETAALARETADAAPPAVPARSKSPAAAARGGTTVFAVPAAARPTAASIAGVRAKSPGPATAVAARSKSPAPAARAKSPGAAGAGAAKRLSRAPVASASAALEEAVSDGKQPRSVPRAKKAEHTPEPVAETSTDDVAVETAAKESEAFIQEGATDAEVATQEHTVSVVATTTAEASGLEDNASLRAAEDLVVTAPEVTTTSPAAEEVTSSDVISPVEAAAPAVTVELAPVVWKEEAVDARLNSMFDAPPLSMDSADGPKSTVLSTPPLSPMTPGPSNTDAFNPALIGTFAASAKDSVSVESTAEPAEASPSKKAAFERLMKRLNSNKEGASVNDAANSNRASPVVVAPVSEANEVTAAVTPVVLTTAAASTTSTTTANSTANTTSEEPFTRRLSVAEMRAQFSGGVASPVVKEPVVPRTPVVVTAPVIAPVTAVANQSEGDVSKKDLSLDILDAEAVNVEFTDTSPTSQDVTPNGSATATVSPFKSGEVKVPSLTGLTSATSPVTPSTASPMKRAQSTRVSELMNKFGGSRRDLSTSSTSPVPAAAPVAVTRNASVRGSIASISGISAKKSVFEKGELNSAERAAEVERAEVSAPKSPSSTNNTNSSTNSSANKRSKSPASLSRNGSSNNLASAAGGSLSPKSPSNSRAAEKSPQRNVNKDAAKSPVADGALLSNPTSPTNKPATSLKSVPSFTTGSATKSAAAAVFTFAETEEKEKESNAAADSAAADVSAKKDDTAKEVTTSEKKEPLPVLPSVSTELAPPSYEDSSIDASMVDTFITPTNASATAVRAELDGTSTPPGGRTPVSTRTPGTARTVTLASPEQLPLPVPVAVTSSPSTVELLQAVASTESEGSLEWDGHALANNYSHSLQVSRSEDFIRTSNNTSQLPLQSVPEGERNNEGEKEEDLTAVLSAVSATLTARFQANKSSENVLAAMEAEHDRESVGVTEQASTEPVKEVVKEDASVKEEEEGQVLDFNVIETSVKSYPDHSHAVGKSTVLSSATHTNNAPASSTVPLTTTSTTSVAVTTSSTSASDKTNITQDNANNANGTTNGYSRVESGRFSAVDSDVSMSAPATPLTSFTNVTSSVKMPNTSSTHLPVSQTLQPEEGAEGEVEGDFQEGDFGNADGMSETASIAGSTATNGSKKHRRPTLKGLWKRLGGSGKHKPGTEL